MGKEVALTALASLISLAGICYLLFWRYRSLRVDKFRQDMFELRDELFDFAVAGNIDFNERAYGILRSTLNGYIRHAHRMTLWHAIFLGLLVRKEDFELADTFSKRWERATKRLPADTKSQLKEFHDRMEMLVAKHFFTAAPEFFFLIPILLLIVVVDFTLFLVRRAARHGPIRLKTIQATTWLKVRRGLRLSKMDDAALLYGEQVA